MPEAALYDASLKEQGTVKLPPELDGDVNESVLHAAVRAFLANQRQGTHSTKTRSEVSGGSQKPWRQKGTGRARQGSIRSPHWRGGGVVFGPKPRDYRIDLPRKVRRKARISALNARANDGKILVIESLAFDAPRTRQMVEILEKLGVADRKVLVLTSEHNRVVYLSARNLPRVHVMRYAEATAYEILWSDVVLVERGALESSGDEGGSR